MYTSIQQVSHTLYEVLYSTISVRTVCKHYLISNTHITPVSGPLYMYAGSRRKGKMHDLYNQPLGSLRSAIS